MEREYDRRRAIRYYMHAPVVFQYTEPNLVTTYGGGFVKDISINGVFVRSTHALEPGQTLDLEVLVPPLGNTDLAYTLRSTGRVVRLDSGGFAASAEFSFSRLP
jgi:hypothetical protein